MEQRLCRVTVIPMDEETTTEEEEVKMGEGTRKITFSTHVSVIDIPSRDSYSTEERMTLWMPPHDLRQMTEKNLLEFAAEGWFWENVVEEDGMEMVDGNFIHPIHLNPMLKEALRRQIPYPRAITPPDEDLLFRNEQINLPDDPIDRPSSPFVETVFDQEYSSEDDDEMLLQDPDAYLNRRFAHHYHRKPREDIPFGDSDDAFFTQMLYSDHRRDEGMFPP